MESNQPLDTNFSESLNINSDIKAFLKETAKWANFIAIVGFVMIGLVILMFLFMGSIMGTLFSDLPGGSELGMGAGVFGGFAMVLNLIFLGIFIFPLLYLYRFAQNTKAALRSDNQEALTLAFQNLKSHYKFYGIFLAIMLGIYALIFAFALVAGVGAAAF